MMEEKKRDKRSAEMEADDQMGCFIEGAKRKKMQNKYHLL